MASTVELQISIGKFVAAAMATLKSSPPCLPPAIAGLQLQRVRYRSAVIRHDKTQSFLVWWEPGPWDQSVPWTWIEGKVVQLAVGVTLDIASTVQIETSPNQLVAPAIQYDATIILDLDCSVRPRGQLVLQYTVSDVLGLPSLGGPVTPQWLRDQVNSFLNVAPLVMDFSNSLPPGMDFQNAGVAVDAGGTLVAIRAEVPMGNISDPMQKVVGKAGAPPGTTIENLPGVPFRYRASIPIATPPHVNGVFEELITTPDGFSLAGTWGLPNLVEGELGVDVSEFGWQPVKTGCDYGELALHAFDDNPKQQASLYAEVSLTASGTVSARLCSVEILSAPGTSTGLEIVWQASRLPATVMLHAPSSFADLVPAPTIVLEVRTTLGVFHVLVPPPAPLTTEDIHMMRSLLVMRLRYCDSITLPDWFKGHGKFDLDWIVDPLVDPDYGHGWVSLAELAVTGIAERAQLRLEDTDARLVASTTIGRRSCD